MNSSNNALKFKVFSGFLWRFTEKAGTSVVRFAVSVILARILAPEFFGIMAIVFVFVGFADLLIESGFKNALIQKENADELDFSTVFYFTTAISFVLYALIFFAAPIIAEFYEYTQITAILRLVSLRLIITGVNTAQTAYASRNMLFKRFFWSNGGAVVLSTIVALVMAFAGFGIWSLAAQNLASSAGTVTILWFTLKWRPTLSFSWQRMKGMYSYGWKLLLSAVILNIYSELRTLFIGRLYSSADLAYYTRGKNFPALISDNATRTIGSVIFPAFSQKQKSAEAVKNIMRQSMSAASYLICPMMAGLAIIAEPLVLLLLTDTWIEAVPFLQIACWSFALQPLQNANIQAIDAMGRSDVTLKLRILKTAIGIGILLIVMRHGVFAIALSTILTSSIFSVINIIPNAKLINYRFTEQMADILPYIGLSAIMAAIIYPLRFLQISDTLIIFLQIIIGASVYLLLSGIFKLKVFHFILNTAKQFFQRR